MKALSIRQPWAWLICFGGKDIENRCWGTRFRGAFLLHAAKGMTRAEYEDCADFANLPPYEKLERGGIVGVAHLVDCVTAHSSEWFNGPYGFVLAEVRALPFVACQGALGFFDVPPAALVACLPALDRVGHGSAAGRAGR